MIFSYVINFSIFTYCTYLENCNQVYVITASQIFLYYFGFGYLSVI